MRFWTLMENWELCLLFLAPSSSQWSSTISKASSMHAQEVYVSQILLFKSVIALLCKDIFWPRREKLWPVLLLRLWLTDPDFSAKSTSNGQSDIKMLFNRHICHTCQVDVLSRQRRSAITLNLQAKLERNKPFVCRRHLRKMVKWDQKQKCR